MELTAQHSQGTLLNKTNQHTGRPDISKYIVLIGYKTNQHTVFHVYLFLTILSILFL